MKNSRHLFYWLLLLAIPFACTTSTNEDLTPNFVEGYLVSSFVCEKTGASGQAIGENTKRGYGILLMDSKSANSHWPLDFYTFNLPTDLFDFPQELLSDGPNGADCGPVFFPESHQKTYKIKFQYVILSESEKEKFACGPCTAQHLSFPWENYIEVAVKNVTKLELDN